MSKWVSGNRLSVLVLLGALMLVHWQCDSRRTGVGSRTPELGSIAFEVEVPVGPGNRSAAKVAVGQGHFHLTGDGLASIDTVVVVQGSRLAGRLDEIPVGEWTVRLDLEEENDNPLWTASAPVSISAGQVSRAALVLQRVGDVPPAIDSLALEPPVLVVGGELVMRATVRDRHDATDSLQVRWDVDNDGSYEVDWGYAKEARHAYGSAGRYTVKLEVKDRSGQVNSRVGEVEVFSLVARAGEGLGADTLSASLETERIQLDGRGSEGRSGVGLLYHWHQVTDLPGVQPVSVMGTFSDNDSEGSGLISFSPTEGAGTYVFALEVEDAKLGWRSAPDTLVVTVVQPNRVPVADAGADRTVDVGVTVTLDGSGSNDADGDGLSYRWTSPTGISLSSATAVDPTFTADAAGTYRFQLVVNDGALDSAADEVVIEVGASTAPPAAGGAVETLTVDLPGGATMEFAWIEAGTFLMGSPETEIGRDEAEGPQHQVTISRGFYLGQFEVTQGQWERIMGTKPWVGRDNVRDNANHPAVYISWDDAQDFIAMLNSAAGDSLYRLPSEAEWEYAARAGSQARWSFGDDVAQLRNYAWYNENAWDVGLNFAQAVGGRLANPWGLHDMHGNVDEWVQDGFDSSYYGLSPSVDPTGPSASAWRIYRGGNYFSTSRFLRSANRDWDDPFYSIDFIGFRVLRMEVAVPAVNQAPVGDAGTDQTVNVGATVGLRGTGSVGASDRGYFGTGRYARLGLSPARIESDSRSGTAGRQ